MLTRVAIVRERTRDRAFNIADSALNRRAGTETRTDDPGALGVVELSS
jgi:hypothetical protein